MRGHVVDFYIVICGCGTIPITNFCNEYPGFGYKFYARVCVRAIAICDQDIPAGGAIGAYACRQSGRNLSV